MLAYITRSRIGNLITSKIEEHTCCIYSSLTYPRQRQFSNLRNTKRWRRNVPTSLEAVAGLARQAEHESAHQQPPEPAQLSAAPSPGFSTSGQEQTGAFTRLPMVPVSTELIESALKRASKVAGSKKLKNEAQKAKSQAASQLDALTKEIAMPLGRYMKGFPAVSRLHPFEAAMLDLTCGTGPYEQALQKVDALRKSILQMGKGYAGQANKARNKAEALAICQEGFTQVESVYLKSAWAVDELKQLAQKLRRLPVVDPLQPVVALVGAPNVGKSSLVNVLSTGIPEVCDYPFTTRSIKMGHFFIDGHRHQVTDTPGLLHRPLAERNAMERLTLACLHHLPSAVLFVLDLTAQCGTSIAHQLAIRESLLQELPGKLWLDVLSKSDLLEADQAAADAVMHSIQEQGPPSLEMDTAFGGPGSVSAAPAPDSDGYEQEREPQQAIGNVGDGDQQAGLLEQGSCDEVHALGQSRDRIQGSAQGGSLQSSPLTPATQAVLLLPNAIRISSVTQSGIDQLQAAAMQMLSGNRDMKAAKH